MQLSSRRAKEITLHTAQTFLVLSLASKTEEETVELMKDAIEFHLEGLKEDNHPIPKPITFARSIEISV